MSFDWYFVLSEGERFSSIVHVDNVFAAKEKVRELLAHLPRGARLSDKEIADIFDLLLEGSSHGRIIHDSETDPSRIVVYRVGRPI
jgi:hypothetical protein